MTVNDDIANKLAVLYVDEGETSGTALLQRYRSDNALDDWEEYVVHVGDTNFVDDQAAFWAAFDPEA